MLLDVVMPDMDGWETLEQIRDVSGVPVIMLTAEDTERDRVRGLRTGADDYMSKPFGRRSLPHASTRCCAAPAEARSDALTGLPNQRAFSEHIDGMLESVQATEWGGRRPRVFDLDNFKQINDTEGHPAGTRCCDVATRRAGPDPAGEEVFRIGGEEFALVIPGDAAAGVSVAERVRTALVEPRERDCPRSRRESRRSRQDAQTREELFQRADLALYAAKQRSQRRVARRLRPPAPPLRAPAVRPGETRPLIVESRCRRA